MTPQASRLAAFEKARNKIITLDPRNREDGIGVQKEKTTHAILKNTFDADSSHHEIPVGRFIADIFDGEKVTEIQTANFGTMRDKLAYFLEKYPVTLVHPIPLEKRIIWIDPDTGELTAPRKAPKGSPYVAFRELYRIRPYLTHPNLTIVLSMLQVEEYRIRDGWSHDGKKGSHRFDRIPTAYLSEYILHTADDYRALLPESLPDIFTAADLQKCIASSRKSINYSTVLLLMSEIGAVERLSEKKGRAYQYTIKTKDK